MVVKELHLSGLLLIDLDCHRDSRGYFVERFNKQKLSGLLPALEFAQDNHSQSAHRVLRGLHFQIGQAKLITAIRGHIVDVVVDIRKNSATYGQNCMVKLSSDLPQLLWVPDGFAHGFCVMSNEGADVIYKTTTPYDPKKESGIFYGDPELRIEWPIESPIVSERDQKLMSFSKLP